MSTLNIDDIIKANIPKTSITLTKTWTDVLSKYLLNTTEELDKDPMNGINLFLHLTGQGAAKSMFEQQMRINELHENTAILPKSLINYLSSDELTGIFGKPADTTFVLCIEEDNIKNLAVQDDDDPERKTLVINKDMKFTLDGYPTFTLPYNIVVCSQTHNVLEYDEISGTSVSKKQENIFAYYDIPIEKSGLDMMFGIRSPNIVSRKLRIQNKQYIGFFIRTYQMERTTNNFIVTDVSLTDFKMSFGDNLVGFEVFKKKNNTDNFYIVNAGLPDGNNVTVSDGFNYSYDYKQSRQNLNVSFNKGLTNNLSIGDEIKVVIYTTKGETGNINFTNIVENLDQLIVDLNQDINDPTQNKVLEMLMFAFARDTSSKNGKNQSTLQELRQMVINKKYSINNILITSNDIINKARNLGLTCYKTRHDVIAMYYMGIGKLTMDNVLLSTGMNDFEFGISSNSIYPDYDDDNIDKLQSLKGDSTTHIITPSDIFKYNNSKFKYVSPDNVDSYITYVNEYKDAMDPSTVLQAQFPFFIKYTNSANPSVDIYDMTINDIQFLEYTDYNEDVTLDNMDITTFEIKRNPLLTYTSNIYKSSGELDRISYDKNKYYIRFNVYTNANSLNIISDELRENRADMLNERYFNIQINIKEINSKNQNTILGIPPKNITIDYVDHIKGYFSVLAHIETDNFISQTKKISICDIYNRLTKDTFKTMIDTSVKFQITGRFKNESTTSITYESEYIDLVKYVTDDFGVSFDIKTSNIIYKTRQVDKISTYKFDVTEVNPLYDPTIEFTTTDIRCYPYTPELTSDGDIVTDSLGLPIFKKVYRKGEDKIHNVDDLMYRLNEVETYATPILDNDNNHVKYTEEVIEYEYRKGDYILDSKGEKQIVDTTYIGVLKNVPWANRLYFNKQNFMSIHGLYKELTDTVDLVRNQLFEGGIIETGLATTSGRSKKYKAYNLVTDQEEDLLDLALSMSFKVKFRDTSTVDYKRQQIVDISKDYVNNLGDDDFSIDRLFDKIKEVITDIEYINILSLNHYKNGSCQTILNDPTVSNEVLTISQTISYTTNDNGDIENIHYIPDINIRVVGVDDI